MRDAVMRNVHRRHQPIGPGHATGGYVYTPVYLAVVALLMVIAADDVSSVVLSLIVLAFAIAIGAKFKGGS